MLSEQKIEWWAVVNADGPNKGGVVVEVFNSGYLGLQHRAAIFLGRNDAERLRAFLARTYPSLKVELKKLPVLA